jgi:hypothetical protein
LRYSATISAVSDTIHKKQFAYHSKPPNPKCHQLKVHEDEISLRASHSLSSQGEEIDGLYQLAL